MGQWGLGIGFVFFSLIVNAQPDKITKERLATLGQALDTKVPGLAEVKTALVRETLHLEAGLPTEGTPGLKLLLSGPPILPTHNLLRAYADHLDLPIQIIPLSVIDGPNYEQGRLASILLELIETKPNTLIVLDGVDNLSTLLAHEVVFFLRSPNFTYDETPEAGQEGETKKVTVDLSASRVVLLSKSGTEFLEKFQWQEGYGFHHIGKKALLDEVTFLKVVASEETVAAAILNSVQKLVPISPPSTEQEFRALLEYQVREHLGTLKPEHAATLTEAELLQLLKSYSSRHYSPDSSIEQAFTLIREEVRDRITEKTLGPEICKNFYNRLLKS